MCLDVIDNVFEDHLEEDEIREVVEWEAEEGSYEIEDDYTRSPNSS